MPFDVDWVDAFTDRPFGGNGCAVVHGGARLDDETCKNFVRETSLVECTYTGPSDVADVRVRYFVASAEIPFAGHPTVATAVALRERGLIGDGPSTLETGAGIIPIEVEGNRVRMTQIAPDFGAHVPAELVAAVGGISADQIAHSPRIVSTGLPFCITVLKSKDALKALRHDIEGHRAYAAHLGLGSTDLLEPFWVVPEGFDDAGDTAARLLMAPPNPPEDPFTGSATGAMAAYLWAEGLIDKPNFVAQQGFWMGRPGQAEVEVLGPRDAISGVSVTGSGYRLMSGTLHLD